MPLLLQQLDWGQQVFELEFASVKRIRSMITVLFAKLMSVALTITDKIIAIIIYHVDIYVYLLYIYKIWNKDIMLIINC